MVAHLAEVLDGFPGTANQTRCFAHTLSITAKADLKQFDIPKGKLNDNLDATAQAFADLTRDLDIEEQSAWGSQEMADDDKDVQPLDIWVDFHDGLMQDEVEELDTSIQPMRSMLSKVH